MSTYTTGVKEDFNGAVFERMILILPYRAPDAVKTIEEQFERINIENLKLDNARYLNTKELTDEEQKDRSLDFLGGFELMDSEFRIFIIEGLGGEGHAMNRFYKANERARPNDKKFKMIYNPQVRYKNRMYMDFNCSMKRIRLRTTLTEAMSGCDIYLRSKVPEDVYDTLQKIAEIRKLDRASLVRDFNLFPVPKNLLTIERKYGDALSHEDINGVKLRKRRRTKLVTGAATSMGTTGIDETAFTERGATSERGAATSIDMRSSMNHTRTRVTGTTAHEDDDDSDYLSHEEVEAPKKLKADTDHKNFAFAQSLRLRDTVAKDNYLKMNKESLKTMSHGNLPKARIDVPDGFEVNPYGNQKNNIWEIQKEQMRKLIAHDKEHFYTYSKHYLSGSFPVVNENQIKMKEKLDREAKWRTKSGFDALNKRANWNEHPKKPD